EGRWLLRALVVNLYDMPAKLRLHGLLGVGARLQRHGGILELRHHPARAKIAQVAATGFATRVGGVLVGKFLEIGAFVELLDDGFGLRLLLHENMTGVYLVDRRPG